MSNLNQATSSSYDAQGDLTNNQYSPVNNFQNPILIRDSGSGIARGSDRILNIMWNEYPERIRFQSDTLRSVDRDMDDEPLPIPKPLDGLDKCILQLQLRLSTLREPVLNADTLIYLGRLGIKDEAMEKELKVYFTKQPILVERSRLFALNSQYFTKFLGPFYQSKRWKSLQPLISDCVLPQSIEYIINMTPETEGMEAVEAIQNLSCPPGVLEWKESNKRWSNSMKLVGGLDENDGVSTVEAEEYSRVRHIKSIERFMIALQGQDPGFDSATKLYTTVMVSKPWNIQGIHPLTDWALGWLCADPNTRFIEALPETTLKLAEVMKCGSLCKDAFGILVGEAVLDSAVNSSRPGFLNEKTTMYERIRGDIQEDWQNRIQHARNSFQERVQKTFHDLVGGEMEWVSDLRHVRCIRSQALELGKETEYKRFLNLFKIFIRSTIYKILCSDYNFMTESWASGHAGGDGLYPRNAGTRIWRQLRAQERIFTRWFWKMLNSSHFRSVHGKDCSNHSTIMTCYSADGISEICLDYVDTKLLEEISIERLDDAIFKATDQQLHCLASSPRATRKRSAQSQESPSKIKAQKITSASENETVNPTQQSQELPSHHSNRGLALRPGHGESLFNQLEDPLSTGPGAQTGVSVDATTQLGGPQCSYWQCNTYLISESLHKTCPSCEDIFCPDHVRDDRHICSLSNVEVQPTADSEARQNDIPSVTDDHSLPVSNGDKDEHQSYRSPVSSAWGDESDESDETDNEPRVTSSTILTISRVLLNSVKVHLKSIAKPMLSGVSGGNLGGEMFDYHLVHTLTCLNDEETKFLPLWADGLDDETGGVFGDYIPESRENAPVLGPGGRRYPSRSEGSEYSFASGSMDSTINTSTLGHDGYRDTLPRKQVVFIDDQSDASSVGGWSFVQDKVDDVKKGKQAVVFAADDSEIASTLGGLDDDDVIDLGYPAAKGDVPLQKEAPTASTSEVNSVEVDHLDDIFMTFDDETSEPEEDEDSDMDTIDADDIMDDVQVGGIPKPFTQSQKPNSAGWSRTTSSGAKSKASKSLANVVYAYKEGNEDDDDDLMTRI